MLNVLRHYQSACGNSPDSRRLKGAIGKKFFTLGPGEELKDTLRSLLFFASWHSKNRGPCYAIGSHNELLEFWAGMHACVDGLSNRRFLSFANGALHHIDRDGNYPLLAGWATTPTGAEDEEFAYTVPRNDKSLWVIVNWDTVPRVFLQAAPLCVVVPRWVAPAIV